QLAVGELLATVQAEVLVAAEENRVAERRGLRAAVIELAGAGHDAVQVDGAALVAEAGDAAPNGANLLSQGPDDELTGVERGGLLPGQPFDGAAGDVEAEDLGMAVGLFHKA